MQRHGLGPWNHTEHMQSLAGPSHTCGMLQGNVLPAGLDLGSISALAAALGVQSVALPG